MKYLYVKYIYTVYIYIYILIYVIYTYTYNTSAYNIYMLTPLPMIYPTHASIAIKRRPKIHVSFTTSPRETSVWYQYVNLLCSFLYLDIEDDVGGISWGVCVTTYIIYIYIYIILYILCIYRYIM